jgi:hypothetical protein
MISSVPGRLVTASFGAASAELSATDVPGSTGRISPRWAGYRTGRGMLKKSEGNRVVNLGNRAGDAGKTAGISRVAGAVSRTGSRAFSTCSQRVSRDRSLRRNWLSPAALR